MADNVEALNIILDTYMGRCKCLETIARDGVLRMNKVIQAKVIYLGLSDLSANLNARMEEFEDNLPLDELDDPIIPIYRQEGYQFWPEKNR